VVINRHYGFCWSGVYSICMPRQSPSTHRGKPGRSHCLVPGQGVRPSALAESSSVAPLSPRSSGTRSVASCASITLRGGKQPHWPLPMTASWSPPAILALTGQLGLRHDGVHNPPARHTSHGQRRLPRPLPRLPWSSWMPCMRSRVPQAGQGAPGMAR
jgi:hypothetical protein